MKKSLLALAALAAAVLIPAPASAASAVDVTVTPGGLTAPVSAPWGRVSIRVTAHDPEGAWPGLVRLKPGVALGDYLDDLTRAFADGPDALAAAREVEADVTAYGGPALRDGDTGTLTADLSRGVYHLIDYKDVGRPGLAARVRELRVGGTRASASVDASGLVLIHDTPSGARFAAPARLPAGRPFAVVNLSGQMNEAILMPLRDGFGGAEVQAFFTDMRTSPYPFAGTPQGSVVLSPGRALSVDVPLAPGRYALVSWAHDHETGAFHTAQGMWAVVEVA
ncbi:hypothetical protein Afil01_09930 [Actinorhabdospora filicis]|uniref:Uncharacterized protein n=1 Tax=Actinorhabdospora filicis TaxID=1785913 RepID=A0A9W6SIK7_9ACTN|nr:hypothetical protein [Actinorhabdospora filicis]GLZ76186.1 hypothetical protein Afil01_09930 [Actinorhabdospora filicis]